VVVDMAGSIVVAASVDTSFVVRSPEQIHMYY